jgi:hypothetical protein
MAQPKARIDALNVYYLIYGLESLFMEMNYNYRHTLPSNITEGPNISTLHLG